VPRPPRAPENDALEAVVARGGADGGPDGGGPDGGGGSGADGGGSACDDDAALRRGDHADVARLLALMKKTRAENVRARARRRLRAPPRRRGPQRARAVSRAAARRRATRRRRNSSVRAHPGGRAVGAAEPDRGRAHRRRARTVLP
jgi:hypothetical protein